jgi:hypothetical protein
MLLRPSSALTIVADTGRNNPAQKVTTLEIRASANVRNKTGIWPSPTLFLDQTRHCINNIASRQNQEGGLFGKWDHLDHISTASRLGRDRASPFLAFYALVKIFTHVSSPHEVLLNKYELC